MEQLKHTTVILPNAEIESLKEQVRQLTAERLSMIEFIEYLQCGDWFFTDGFWRNDGYNSRTTQELFEYYLICKTRGQKG